MSESARVQRWRQRMREEGKAPMTLWLTNAEKQRLEHLARERHCTPAELVQQALALLHATPTPVTATEQIRPVAATVIDTRHVTDTVSVTQSLSDTVTATLRQILPALVRDVVQEMHTTSTAPVSVTVTDTDTVTATVTDTDNPSVTVTETDTEDVADTVTATLPPFDPAKWKLGRLCVGEHAYHGTQQTLYRLPKMVCPSCDAARARAKRAAKRQAAAR